MAINERLIDTEAAAAAAAVDTDNNLMLHLDANDVDSYDGDGDEWIDIKDHEYKPTTNVAQNFNTVIYTGDAGSNKSISQVGFQPDLVWIKAKNNAFHHAWTDSVRGASSIIGSSYTNAASSQDATWKSNYGQLNSFDADGFTVSNGSAAGNFNSAIPYVAWCFKAGGAPSGSDTVSIDGTSYADEAAAGLTAGTVAVQKLSANNDLGFSIVKYQGNTTFGRTVGHGLDSAPELVIIKSLSNNTSWIVYSSPTGSGKKLNLNSTAGEASTSNFASTTPTSSVFSLSGGLEVNNQSHSYIAYCFTSKRGVSKVGSFEGTGAAGNKIYTGFEPAFVMWKNADNSASNSQWFMFDNQRGESEYLMANSNSALGTDAPIQFHRDGFTVPNVGSINSSGQTHIYYAVAKNTNETSLIADTNLELHLDAASFDGSTNTPTTWTDSSSNSNDGTITGGATFDSELGNYLNFDGSDYVQIADSTNENFAFANRTFTQEYWVNIDDVSASENAISAKRDSNAGSGKRSWILSVISTGSIRFLYYNDLLASETIATSNNVVSSNTWHHIIVNGDGTNCKIYVDGELVQTTAFGLNEIKESGSNLVIGRRGKNNNSYAYFNGKIGQVRMYSTELSASDIRQNYNFTKPSYPNGYNAALGTGTTKPTWNPAGYFNFDGNDYVDLTGQAPFSSSTAQTTNKIKSITGWIKPDTLTARVFPYAVSSSTDYADFFQIGWFNDLSIFRLNIRNGSTSNSRNRQVSITPTTDWVHFVVQVTDTTTEMYINGQAQTVTFTPSSNQDDWITYPSYASTVKHTIGTSRWDTRAYSDGSISKIKMYDKALTGTEITALHSEGR